MASSSNETVNNGQSSTNSFPGPPGPVPGSSGLKRVARACVACRKGKNRCEGVAPCARCVGAGIECVFENPAKKQKRRASTIHSGEEEQDERVGRLEAELSSLGSVTSGLQSTLNLVLQQLSGISNQMGNPSSATMQPSDSHISPASSTSQAQSHHSTSLLSTLGGLGQQGSGTNMLASNGGGGGATFAFSPSGSITFNAGPSQTSSSSKTTNHPNPPSSNTGSLFPGVVHTSAYSPINLANTNFAAHLFQSNHAFTPNALHNTDGTSANLSDVRNEWLSNVSSSHRSSEGNQMPPPPLPSDLAAFRRAGNDLSGYRADNELDLGHSSSAKRVGGSPGREGGGRGEKKRKTFPELPGFAPPETHQFKSYEIVPSTAVSSEDESEDTLPRATLSMPSLALAGLAEAAAAAADGTLSPPRALRMRRRKRAPAPPIFFPDVVTKELVDESEARALYDLFFSGCNLFVPLFDQTYDTFDDLRVRTPFTLDALLAIAAKVRAGPNPPGEVFRVCLAEAQGIARSTLFGPIVQKEAAQAILLLATYSQNSYLPSGHALRAGLDFGLHRALDKLHQGHLGGRSDVEERELVVSSRIWLCIFWFDRLNCLGTGRPILLREDESVTHARILLEHPMRSKTDVRLVAMVELISLRTNAFEQVQRIKDNAEEMLSYLNDVDQHLNNWYSDWDRIHVEAHMAAPEESLVSRKMLLAELHYARLYVCCLALRGVSWDRMPREQKELAMKAKDAATHCLECFLTPEYRLALRFALHESLVMATFSACYLLKTAILFHEDINTRVVLSQVQALADLLSEIAAERYALTLRLMLKSFKRKFPATQPSTPRTNPMLDGMAPSSSSLSHLLQVPATDMYGFNWDEFPSFDWPEEPDFSPDIVPEWLRDNSLTDLGLPVGGSEGIFIPHDLQHVVSDTQWGFF